MSHQFKLSRSLRRSTQKDHTICFCRIRDNASSKMPREHRYWKRLQMDSQARIVQQVKSQQMWTAALGVSLNECVLSCVQVRSVLSNKRASAIARFTARTQYSFYASSYHKKTSRSTRTMLQSTSTKVAATSISQTTRKTN